MLITNGRITDNGLRRRTIQRQVSLGPVTLRVVTIIIFAAAALITLAQSTASATKSYEEQQLKGQYKAGLDDVGELEAQAARARSLKQVVNTDVSPTPTPSASPLQPSKHIDALPTTPNDLSYNSQSTIVP